MLNLERKRDKSIVLKRPSWPVALVSRLLYFPNVVHVIDPDKDDRSLRLRSPVYNVQKFRCDSKARACASHCKEEVVVIRVPGAEEESDILPLFSIFTHLMYCLVSCGYLGWMTVFPGERSKIVPFALTTLIFNTFHLTLYDKDRTINYVQHFLDPLR